MKNSISNRNKNNPANNINFKDLNEAKGFIVLISNELEFHQKKHLNVHLKLENVYSSLKNYVQ